MVVAASLVASESVAFGADDAGTDPTFYGVTSAIPVSLYPLNLAVSERSNLVFATDSSSKSISVFDGETEALVNTIPMDKRGGAIVVDSDHDRLYVASVKDGSLTAIDTVTGIVAFSVAAGATPSGLAVDRERRVVWVSDRTENSLSAFDADSGLRLGVPTVVGTTPGEMAIDATTNEVYLVNRGSDSVSVVDGATRAVTRTVPVAPYPESVAVDEDTHIAYVGHASLSPVSVIDQNQTSLAPAFSAAGYGNRVALDPTSNDLILVSSYSEIVSVMDRTTGGTRYQNAAPPSSGKFVINGHTGTIYLASNGGRSISILTSEKAPVIVSTAITGAAAATVQFTSGAFDAEGPGQINWSLSGLYPAGLKIDRATGVISGVPDARGTYNFVVRATSPYGTDDLNVQLVVAEQPPTKPTVGKYKFYLPMIKGESSSARIEGSTGYPAPRFTADGLPKGLTMGSSGTISGSPKQIGLFKVRVTAKNSSGSTTNILPLRVLGRGRFTADVDFGYTRTTLNKSNRKVLRALARSIHKSATMQYYSVIGYSPNTKHKSKDVARAKKRAWAMTKYLRHQGVTAKPTYFYKVAPDYSNSHSYYWSWASVDYTYK